MGLEHFSFFTAQIKSMVLMYTTVFAFFSKKTTDMVGFETGSSVPEADALSTAPRRQRPILNFTPRGEVVPQD
jgi:hypothetical protein